MAVELAEVAAGLPVAASFALAGGITSLREGRRRSSLNEAMHELRRPLQALALALPEGVAASSSLRLATAALERLDREINRAAPARARVLLSPRPLLAEAALRRRVEAAAQGRPLRLRWQAGEAKVEADPVGLAQAVDNLISNALEHGLGEVTVDARRAGSRLAISVCDRGPAVAAALPGGPPRSRRPRGRHGHGLRVVARVARAHGGSFAMRPGERGTEATLKLPLHSGEERR